MKLTDNQRSALIIAAGVIAAIAIISAVIWMIYSSEAEAAEPEPKQQWVQHTDDAGTIWLCSKVKPTTCILLQPGPGVIVPKGIQRQGTAL